MNDRKSIADLFQLGRMSKLSEPFVLGCSFLPYYRFSSACCLGGVLSPLQRVLWLYMSRPIYLPCFCPGTWKALGHHVVTQQLVQLFRLAKTSTNPVLQNGVLTFYMSLVRSGCIYHYSDSPMHVGACQIGSGAFGEWFWYFYLLVCFIPGFAWVHADDPKIPSYAVFKIWSNFIGPMIGRSSDDSTKVSTSENSTLSKRQEKLRKRSEKGDPRVRTVHK